MSPVYDYGHDHTGEIRSVMQAAWMEYGDSPRSASYLCDVATLVATRVATDAYRDGFTAGKESLPEVDQLRADIQRLREGWQDEQRRHTITLQALWDMKDRYCEFCEEPWSGHTEREAASCRAERGAS